MVAQELSTPASTTTRARNMAVQQSGRTSAATHTAWRRLLICAVSVAATLCCFFVPGAVSPMIPYFPAERGRPFLESYKYDSLENHPPTLLDNPPVLEEAFKVVRESCPWIDEVLKRDFVDTNAVLDEPSKLELTSEDVERYLAVARPNLRANAAKCLWDIKKKDFDEMAIALLHRTYLNETFSCGKVLNHFIREDDLKHEMKIRFRRGFVTASDEKQDHYSAKPSDVSDDLETWVQANIKFGTERDTYEVKLTVHPNVKPNEPEGSILCCTATYKHIGYKDFERIQECFEIKDVDYHAISTGKRGEGANATAEFKNINPYKSILDHELENLMAVKKFGKKPTLSKDGNDKYMFLSSETDSEHVPAMERATLKVDNYGGREEYPRDDFLSIYRKAGTGQRQFKNFDIVRSYSLMNSDCLDKPYYKNPASSPSSEETGDEGKYRARLGIHQKYRFDDERNQIMINIGFFIDKIGIYGTVRSPISFNLQRIVQPTPPSRKDETVEVNHHFCYKTDEQKPVLHMSHRTREKFKLGSFECRTEDHYPYNISSVAFPKNGTDNTAIMKPWKFQDYNKEHKPQSKKWKPDDDLSKILCVNTKENCSKAKRKSLTGEAALSDNDPDDKGQKSSSLGTTLFDGGILFLGIITVFVLVAASLESSRKGKRVRMIQGRVVDSSKNNIFEGQ